MTTTTTPYQAPTDFGTKLYGSMQMQRVADEYYNSDEEKQAIMWHALTDYYFSPKFKDAKPMMFRVTNLKKFLKCLKVAR